jgi:hypothetical protein
MRGKSGGGWQRKVRERETLGSLYTYKVQLIQVMDFEMGLMGQCNN